MQLERIKIQINQSIIISSIDLQIDPGEIFVLMGPSGSGKTTLLKGIAGLIPLTSGKLKWENKQGTTGIVFQEPRLFPHLTVLENIAFGLRVKGIPTKERSIQAVDFLKNLQLESLESRYPHQLSGGQQQRVALGRALILKPDLLLLDEPFASLDTSLRQELIEWLSKLQRQLGFSILWVTHYLDEALSVADRIGIMLEGAIQQIAAPTELFQKPATENIAQFLSLPNRVSRKQWNKWFQSEFNLPTTQNRGWIDPNHLQIINRECQLREMTSSCIVSGIVTKVRPNREGFSIQVTSDNNSLDVNTLGWNKTPKIDEKISIIVPFEKIHWYTE